MPIPFFGPAQDDVFIPALAWFLVAAAFATAPVIFAPVLARQRRGRALTVLSVVVAAAAVVPGVLQAGHGFAVLSGQHAEVRSALATHYGLSLTDAHVSSLLEGGKVKGPDVTASTGSDHLVTLDPVPGQPGVYRPVQATVGPLPEH